uniref:KH domain-containing protein n=1 Tax=Strongyloides papillosus TaxID=174720 RepID=A0A0N5BYF7_STREA
METTQQLEMMNKKLEKHHEDCCTTFLAPKKKTTSSVSSELEILKENVGSRNITMDYLIGLLKEKKYLMMFPQFFPNLDRLLDEEISRVRMSLFQCDFTNIELELPEPKGDVAVVQEKVFVPVKEHPDYNFVGRILGPRGMTAKQLEQETGCKIMVRGKGSLRDKKKEEENIGKPNWEHLEEDLHVLIQCEDTPNRSKIKIKNAIMQVNKLLVPAPEGSDELKRKQLMELAIINGTYRPSTSLKYPISSPRLLPPLNTMSTLPGGNNRTMSCPMYPNSPFNPPSPLGTPPMSAGLTEKATSPTPVPPMRFDYNSSTLDSLFHQMGINGFTNTLLTGTGYPTTPSVFNTPTNQESFTYFSDNKKGSGKQRRSSTSTSSSTGKQGTANTSESTTSSVNKKHH